jgi:branched-chain amino acid transport system ATP-binding protein
LLEVVGVTKRFGGVVALNGVTLRVEPGGVTGLIGPNGAGKTTLFNLISGQLRPDEGTIRFNGRSLVGLPSHEICRLGIARTFQLVQPFMHMSVLDNVASGSLFGTHAGKSTSLRTARQEAHTLLELGKLAQHAARPAGSLTLSERKRLEMVRALATTPTLLLLDEVMAGLNPAELEEMAGVIRHINRGLSITILMIEHNVRLVTLLCQWVAVLNYGVMIAEAAPETVVRNPDVVKAYLGERGQQEIMRA